MAHRQVLHAFVLLGFDLNQEGDDVGPGMFERIELQKEVLKDYWDYVVLCGPGKPHHRSSRTMAEMMADHLRAQVPAKRLIVNADQPKIWSTIEEVVWAVRTLQAKCPDRNIIFCFVTSPRHAERIRFVVRHFRDCRGIKAKYVTTDQERVKSWHEAVSYGKLYALLVCDRLGMDMLKTPFPRLPAIRRSNIGQTFFTSILRR